MAQPAVVSKRASAISLPQVIAAGIDLVNRAGYIIREVAEGGNLMAKDKANESVTGGDAATYDDPQTVADRRAQTLIIDSFARVFPDIKVVGEEDDLGEEAEDKSLVVDPCLTHASVDLAEFPEHLLSIDAAELGLFVDPLDATKEFTKGVLSAVTILFGIIHKGRPIAGVIGRPFKKLDDGTWMTPAWGCVGVGTKGLTFTKRPDCLKLVTTASHSNEDVEEMKKLLQPEELTLLGGSGNKILSVLEGSADLYIYPKVGTSRWDTAAGEAMLLASGGTLVNIYGKPYDYDTSAGGELKNVDGVIACACAEDLRIGMSSSGPLVAAVIKAARERKAKECSASN